MTTASLTWPTNSFGSGGASTSAGVSSVAIELAAQLKRMVQDRFRTAIGQTSTLAAQAALFEGYREAEQQAKYGEQAVPSPAALRESDEFLASLPSWCPPPHPTIEPSGAIAFEWDYGCDRWLVFALKGTGTLEHSAILGFGNELCGTMNFAGLLSDHELKLLAKVVRG